MNKFMGAFINKNKRLESDIDLCKYHSTEKHHCKTAIFPNSHAIAKSSSFHNLRSKRNVMIFEQVSKYC